MQSCSAAIILQVCRCLHESHDESSDGSLKSGNRVSLRHRREVEIVRGVEEHEFELPYALASIAFDLHGHLKGVVHPRGTGPPLRRSSAALPNCNWRLCHPWRLGTMGCHKLTRPWHSARVLTRQMKRKCFRGSNLLTRRCQIIYISAARVSTAI